MVSTRRSGSLSSNNSKRSSSSEDKPPSPKRQKVENGSASEKPTPVTESSKEMSLTATADPVECDSVDPPIAGGSGEALNSVKDEAAMVTVATPVADGGSLYPPRSSFSSWSSYQKQNPSAETSTPWCKLLSQYSQNPNVAICSSIFTIGSSKNCNFSLKDPSLSAILCKIKRTQDQHAGSTVAMLESTGSKGSVQVNGTVVKKNTSRALFSGDEVVFSLMGNYAYIFQQLMTEFTVKLPSTLGDEIQNSFGKLVRLEKRPGDPSAVAGASILASLSSLRQDVSRWKSLTQCTNKSHKGTELPSDTVIHDNSEIELDGLEANSTPITGSDEAAEIGAANKNLPLDCNQDSGNEASNADIFGVHNLASEVRNQWMKDSQLASTSGMSLRCAVFREDIHAGIINGNVVEVSFDDFPYYLSENTKNVLIAASYIHLKHREQAKYTSELPTLNPRILLSGPAGSEIYQEMLAKALAKHFGAKLLIFDSHTFLGVRYI